MWHLFSVTQLRNNRRCKLFSLSREDRKLSRAWSLSLRQLSGDRPQSPVRRLLRCTWLKIRNRKSPALALIPRHSVLDCTSSGRAFKQKQEKWSHEPSGFCSERQSDIKSAALRFNVLIYILFLYIRLLYLPRSFSSFNTIHKSGCKFALHIFAEWFDLIDRIMNCLAVSGVRPDVPAAR